MSKLCLFISCSVRLSMDTRFWQNYQNHFMWISELYGIYNQNYYIFYCINYVPHIFYISNISNNSCACFFEEPDVKHLPAHHWLSIFYKMNKVPPKHLSFHIKELVFLSCILHLHFVQQLPSPQSFPPLYFSQWENHFTQCCVILDRVYNIFWFAEVEV